MAQATRRDPGAARPPAGHRIEAEVFSAGEWNGEVFTRADLEEIARNFARLRGQLMPPLKFGHDEGQTLLGQRDGDPALGWVEALRVAGDRLVATFAGVPTVVRDAIRAGRYRRVSAELYFNVRAGRQRLGKVLKAVALLGADLPAVTNLRELGAYLASVPDEALALGPARAFALPADGSGGVAAGAVPPRTEATEQTTEEASMSESETRGPERAELAELAELRAFKARAEEREAEQARERTAAAFRSQREAARNFCEAQVGAGRMTPHLRDRLLAELDGQARTFAEGQGLRVSLDWVRAFVAAGAPLLPAGEVGQARGAPAGAGDEDPSQTLARLARNRMAELNLSYSEAAEYVLRTNPALARSYRDYTLNPSLGA